MTRDPNKVGAREKLKAFFLANLGRVVTSDQLRAVAQISEWARRVRELRDEEGYQILSHNDRDKLKPNEYLLVTKTKKRVHKRGLSGDLRKKILQRDGYTCQICGAGPGDDAPCEPGKKVRLQVDHIQPISQGGTDDEDNLRVTCVYYNKEKANIIKPVSGAAVSAIALIRKQKRDDQYLVYQWLKEKFESKK